MSNDGNFLTDAFRRQLAETVSAEVIRKIEHGGSIDALWSGFVESGFLDAMVPEAAGGAGLAIADVFGLVFAAGEYLVPLPFAETMMARGFIATGGSDVPAKGVLVLGGASNCIPFGALATHAVVAQGDKTALVETTPVGPDVFRAGGSTALANGAVLAMLDMSADMLHLASAAVASAQMAGAMARVLEMTLRYAGERQQFGRSLSKFQAIQQQLAVLAEQVISAQVAARGAFTGARFDLVRVAAAKCRCNEAATLVCSIAHAVHGAIGATEEFDLQLYTRRLKQWQLAFGSESYWGEQLGRARVRAGTPTTADFLRLHLAHAEA